MPVDQIWEGSQYLTRPLQTLQQATHDAERAAFDHAVAAMRNKITPSMEMAASVRKDIMAESWPRVPKGATDEEYDDWLKEEVRSRSYSETEAIMGKIVRETTLDETHSTEVLRAAVAIAEQTEELRVLAAAMKLEGC